MTDHLPEIAAAMLLLYAAPAVILYGAWVLWRLWREDREKRRQGPRIKHPERLAVHVGNASELRRLAR